MRKHSKKQVAKKQTKWLLNRKQFFGSVLAAYTLSQIPFSNAFAKINSDNPLLTENQLHILKSVQEILFPSDGYDGPGANDINATDYLIWVLSDPNKDPDETKYILNGIGWLDETAKEQYSKKYLDLGQIEKEVLVKLVSKESWGESWLSVILSFIFEALLCDPQYGGNPHSIGWKWLNHYPGQPRPTTNLLYPEILKTLHKS